MERERESLEPGERSGDLDRERERERESLEPGEIREWCCGITVLNFEPGKMKF